MSWTAKYLADGELAHDISTHVHDYQAELALREFVARIPNPTVQPWWGWIENEEGVKISLEDLDGREKEFFANSYSVSPFLL